MKYKDLSFGNRFYIENPKYRGGRPIRLIKTDVGAIDDISGKINKRISDKTEIFLMVT